MSEESFVLVSLKESKAKKLAQVIGSETCRKILDHLASKKDATESAIAKELSLPISTVHYNLKHLYDNQLVEVDEFHYSEKGKEVNHYKLANKLIIIAPKESSGLMEKLKGILPVSLFAVAAAGAVHLLSGMEKAALSAASFEEKAVPARALMEAAPQAADAAVQAVPQVAPQIASTPSIALWFLLGAMFTVMAYVLWELIRLKMENKGQ
ncbi:MAG: helix-turn-helix domain-containing protein [archaeon]